MGGNSNIQFTTTQGQFKNAFLKHTTPFGVTSTLSSSLSKEAKN